MKLFKYASMMLAMFAAVSFVSCGDDDDDEIGIGGTNVSINMKDLYGMWDPVYIKYTEEYDGEKDSEEGKVVDGWPEYWGEEAKEEQGESDGCWRNEFLENGIMNRYYYEKGQWHMKEKHQYTYKVTGNIITMYVDGQKADGEVVNKITKLDNSTLVIEATANGQSYKHWTQITYKKVK